MEPYRLKRWKVDSSPDAIYFYTCARPGRSKYNYKKKNNEVSDDLVSAWVLGLPGPNTAIISLLGRKPADGTSEFSFYSFCGGWDTYSECETFQDWIDQWHGDIQIRIREHPTYDRCKIPPEKLDAIAADVRKLTSEGRTVVVVDSGGVGRTGQVVKHMKAIEDNTAI